MPPTKPGDLLKMLNAQSKRARAVARPGSAFARLGDDNRAAQRGRKRRREDEAKEDDENAEGYEDQQNSRQRTQVPARKVAKKARPSIKPRPKHKKPSAPQKPLIESWRPAGGEQASSERRKKGAPKPTAILGIARVATWRLQLFKPAIDDMIRQNAEFEKMVSNTMIHGGESLTDVYVHFSSASVAAKVKEAIDGKLLEERKLQVGFV